jgi:hypothetical protein
MPGSVTERVSDFATVRGEASAPWALPSLLSSSIVAFPVARARCLATAARAAHRIRRLAVPAEPTAGWRP